MRKYKGYYYGKSTPLSERTSRKMIDFYLKYHKKYNDKWSKDMLNKYYSKEAVVRSLRKLLKKLK